MDIDVIESVNKHRFKQPKIQRFKAYRNCKRKMKCFAINLTNKVPRKLMIHLHPFYTLNILDSTKVFNIIYYFPWKSNIQFFEVNASYCLQLLFSRALSGRCCLINKGLQDRILPSECRRWKIHVRSNVSSSMSVADLIDP